MKKQQTEMGESKYIFLAFLLVCSELQRACSHGDHPLSKVSVHKATVSLLDLAHIKASPSLLGLHVSFNSVVWCKFICFIGDHQFVYAWCFYRDKLQSGSLWSIVLQFHQMMIGLECSLLQTSGQIQILSISLV